MSVRRDIKKAMLPPKPRFRFFKYIDHKGVWGRTKEKIYNSVQLHNYINKRNIFVKDLYCSIGYFQNPQIVATKYMRKTGSFTDFNILGCDFLFEIDEKDINMFSKGINLLRMLRLKDFEMCETPRGYQCRVTDFTNYLRMLGMEKVHYSRRFQFIEQIMKETAIVLKNGSIKFDYKVCDPMRVCRVRNYPSSKLTLIRPIDERELYRLSPQSGNMHSDEVNHPMKREEGEALSSGAEDARSSDKPLPVSIITGGE